VSETFPETSASALANTTLSDRELLIHLLQHVEVMGEQMNEITAQLAVFRPLLDQLAPGGKPDMLGAMQARRTVKAALRAAGRG
jgi:hypothetical protein